MATTEPHKILPTILSRCQRYDFNKVSEKDIKERIRTILLSENIEYNEDAIDLIVSLADGGMRDALSILEKVLAYSGNKLVAKDVLDIFALESKEEKIKLIESIVHHDMHDVLSRLNNYISKGTDIKRLTEDLLVILKDIVIYSSSANDDYLETLKEDEAIELGNIISDQLALEMIDVLMSAVKDYKNVTSINPLFEITLIKLTSIKGDKQIKQEPKVEVKKEEAPVKIEAPSMEKPVFVVPKVEPAVEPIKEDVPSMFDVKLVDNVIYLRDAEQEDSFQIDDNLMVNIMAVSKKEIKSELLDGWKKIKKYSTNPTIGKAATLLIDGRPLVASNKIVILEYQLPKQAEKINAKDIQFELQTVIKEVFNRQMFVYAVSRNKSVDLQSLYMNLLQIGKLPKAKDITLEFIGE